jgi:multidrug efflux system outer membrane protein
MEQIEALTQSTLELREQSLALITKGRDLGGAYDLEVQQAISFVESARASLDGMTHQRAVALNRLNFLVGHAPLTMLPGKPLDEQGLDADLKPGLPAEVLLVRPDVVAAEQRLLAAHANIEAARAAFLPRILLTAGMGVASQGLSSLFSGSAWSFQPTISLPLFDGGRVAANADIAQARKVMAVAEYEKTIQLAFREVADLLSARASLASQVRASAATLRAQQRRLQIVQARYDTGLLSYLDVLEGQRELVAAQEAGIQVRRAQLESAAQLYKALGGGLPI